MATNSHSEELVDIRDDKVIQAIWEKGIVVEGFDPALYRRDSAGAWIIRESYGNRDSDYGWEIDHVYPQSLGGQDHLVNLRPMHWRNNRSKDGYYPHYETEVVADGNRNIEKIKGCTVNTKLQKALNTLYNITND